ncbi:hypothetical protein BS50DRAFT_573468 [Corynespora cassiicola Philippines]|uniref:Nuclear pore complex protein Nup85 n=1 Tax=Corynespora cassiicola Philippines TaxID=1448308 RepID=A0A2T2NMH2_CORCC|nr:hypothetical protein BS50DRAFT_573468 [Corynespora cassiicola Philippines]
MFRVPSSSPPSTPGSHRSTRHLPSTTPAGAPPDRSFMSSTPAGPPPGGNSLFGSSRPNLGNPKAYNFNTSTFDSSPPKNSLFGASGPGGFATKTAQPSATQGRPISGRFRAPSLSDEDDDEDAEGEDEDMDNDEAEDFAAAARPARGQTRLSQSVASRASNTDTAPQPFVVPGAKQTRYDLSNLAKGLAPSLDHTNLQEPDDAILETERILEKLSDDLADATPEKRGELLGEAVQELVASWQSSTKGGVPAKRSPGSSSLSNASMLAELLLGIHHPALIAQKQRATAFSLIPAHPGSRHFTPIPRVLLDWLNTYHNTTSEVDIVKKEQRGYSAHPGFWDAVHTSLVRGKFTQAIDLLNGAHFEYAVTASEDGLGDSGYSGLHLRHTNEAVRVAVQLLEECPAVAGQDWDVKGHDWNIYRQRVQQEYDNLQDFAEGESQNRYAVGQSFQASSFGLSQSQASFNLSVASRRAESKVPWTVYEMLNRLYQILLGNDEELLALAADWIEAVMTLVIWWDGEETDVASGSLAASRRSLSRPQRVRTADVTPVKGYCQRLSAALAAVLEDDEGDLDINTTSRFEVGVACIVDDNIEGALDILRSGSITVASAVAEIAAAGEWLGTAGGLLKQFDTSDLMVLSYAAQPRTGSPKDELLLKYSQLLASRGQVMSADSKGIREGWELAIQVLGRLDDVILANSRIEGILNDLPLQSADRVDKTTQLCHNMGLSEQALGIALVNLPFIPPKELKLTFIKKYADHLRANTHDYGNTLLYYARAHAALKIQEVLRVLVAHCLVKSIAFPPPEELDDALASLITSPKQTLTKLASVDSEAAQLLSNHLSGYATIRKFYDLRDEEILVKEGEKPAHRPMARRRAAANALMVIISSAASSIRGGLYDPEVETVVQVDVLLPLLGEALVFVNQPKRTLTLRHLYNLLAAIEDLTTAPSMIRAQCEEVLTTTLSAAHGNTRNLSKSISNLTTASSQYSLIGSSDFGSADGQSIESSTVLVKDGSVDESRRGWDWRTGFKGRATGEDVLTVLRLNVTREIARAFAEGETNV